MYNSTALMLLQYQHGSHPRFEQYIIWVVGLIDPLKDFALYVYFIKHLQQNQISSYLQ